MNRQNEPIAQNVMEQIKSGRVRMKPRWYYSLLTASSAIAVVLAGFSIAYVSSIVFFWLRVETADTMARGARANLQAAIDSFPWWALVLSIVLSAVAIMLVRNQGRLYRHRTSTIALLLVACSLVVGIGLSYLDVGKPHQPNRPGIQSEQHGYGRMQNR